MSPNTPPTASAAPYEKRWWALGALVLSLFVIMLDETITNVTLPSIRESLDASSSQLQWVTDSYILVFACLLLAAGSLGDRFGRRRALQLGLTIFIVGSVSSALSTSAAMLIASRALMGVGGAFIMPSTLSIISQIFPREERGRAIAIWAAVSGVGVVLGPLAGGLLLERFDWSSVFWVNVPIVIVAAEAVRRLVPESSDHETKPIDFAGLALSITGLSAVTWAIIEASERGFTNPTIVTVASIGFAVLAAFVAWELHSPNPMLQVRLFRNPRFSSASVAIAIMFAGLQGIVFVFTQYLQTLLGYSALEAGAAMVPSGLGMIAASPISARLNERFGTKIVVAGGLGTVAASMSVAMTLDAGTSYPLIGITFALMGAGIGLAMVPATDSIMAAVPQAMAGVGSAMNDTTRMVGGALGVAVLGSVLTSGYGGEMDGAIGSLPPAAAHTAGDSLGGAVAVASEIGGTQGDALTHAAHGAFLAGMGEAALIGAALAVAGAILAARFLPAREPAGRATVITEPEGDVLASEAAAA